MIRINDQDFNFIYNSVCPPNCQIYYFFTINNKIVLNENNPKTKSPFKKIKVLFLNFIIIFFFYNKWFMIILECEN